MRGTPPRAVWIAVLVARLGAGLLMPGDLTAQSASESPITVGPNVQVSGGDYDQGADLGSAEVRVVQLEARVLGQPTEPGSTEEDEQEMS